jgi:hypothetical protein
VPKEKKTKQGYLKDGFVVDSSDTEENVFGSGSEQGDDEDESEETEEDDDIVIEDLGSELSEESYDYDAEEVEK